MKLTLLPLAALLLASTLAFRAQTPAPAPAAIPIVPVPTVITAGYSELWTDATGTESYGLFRENVVVTGTNLRITCDRIDAVFAGKNDPQPLGTRVGTAQNIDRVKSIIATGKVRIVQGDREANSERAEVFPREGKVILTGKPVAIDHGSGSTVVGEPMTLLKNERRVIVPNSTITLPEMQDLGFEKDAPAPKPQSETAPAK